MNQTQRNAVLAVLVLGAGGAWWIASREREAGHHDHEGHGHAEEEAPRGPHRGRLLADGDLQVEVTIYEKGVPPQSRVYVYEGGKPVDPALVELTVELRRLTRTDVLRYRKEGDYLLGDRTVEEPHSFGVEVLARYKGREHRWTYPSYEGRTELSPEAVEASGIVVEEAGPAVLRAVLKVNGRIVPNEDRLKHVTPRFPGVLKEVRKRLGDPVAEGEVLAVVESNESLQTYEIRSALAGTVIQKRGVAGEFIPEGEILFTVADLSTVWVDLDVYRQDFPRVKAGLAVEIDAGDGLPKAKGTLDYVSPVGAEHAQAVLARTVLPNPDGILRPGLFVAAEIVVEEVPVPLAVKASGLQTFRDWTVVFVRKGSLFEIAPLETGRRDDAHVEVLSGLMPGQPYVAEGSFVVKADILKSGATHDH